MKGESGGASACCVVLLLPPAQEGREAELLFEKLGPGFGDWRQVRKIYAVDCRRLLLKMDTLDVELFLVPGALFVCVCF